MLDYQWLNGMMKRLLRSDGWSRHVELLRTRWKNSRKIPSDPIRRYLEETAEGQVNEKDGDEGAGAGAVFVAGMDQRDNFDHLG